MVVGESVEMVAVDFTVIGVVESLHVDDNGSVVMLIEDMQQMMVRSG